MLTKIKKVYYCEHCGRHRLTPNSIEKHEKGCTANPNRVCGVCECATTMKDLLAKYEGRFGIYVETNSLGYESRSARWAREPVTLDELRTDTDGCPVCMLAVIRQCDLNNSPGEFSTFDYQTEHRQYWQEKNDLYEHEMEYYG